jgi:hypothetical protein
MKKFGNFVLVAAMVVAGALSVAGFTSGCHHISLSGTKGSPGTQPGSDQSGGTQLDGDWIITFEYKENAFDSAVTFSQKGDQLAGQGTDPNGAAFYLQDGTVKGKHVHFSKKYADGDPNKPAVDYDGDIQWSNVEEYKGWEVAGHYKTATGETGKWIAVPKDIPQQAQGGGETGGEQQAQAPPSGEGSAPTGGETEQAAPGHEPNISGMYEASYNFNFKRIHSKLWLNQDGHQVTGHGVDTNTNEQFVVTKGFYSYPKVTLICKYTKGKSAAANRDITFKAKVAPGPQMKGETQFGGGWEAHIVR